MCARVVAEEGGFPPPPPATISQDMLVQCCVVDVANHTARDGKDLALPLQWRYMTKKVRCAGASVVPRRCRRAGIAIPRLVTLIDKKRMFDEVLVVAKERLVCLRLWYLLDMRRSIPSGIDRSGERRPLCDSAPPCGADYIGFNISPTKDGIHITRI